MDPWGSYNKSILNSSSFREKVFETLNALNWHREIRSKGFYLRKQRHNKSIVGLFDIKDLVIDDEMFVQTTVHCNLLT